MAEGTDGSVVPSLPQLFLHGWRARTKIESCELDSRSPDYAKCLLGGVAALERATRLASQMSLFSENEGVEEVATGSLKYMLLPALLGDLTLHRMDGNRLETLSKAKVYCVDYLQRCKSYSITQDEPPPLTMASHELSSSSSSSLVLPATPSGGGQKSLEQLSAERAAKIQRHKEQRVLEKRAETLGVQLSSGESDSEGVGTGEDEGAEERDQWLDMLKLWVYKSQDLVHSAEEEASLLQEMERAKKETGVAARGQGGGDGSGSTWVPQQPAKPLVITREMLQGGVFGAGYPSLPSMTVEQFYQQQYGAMATGGVAEEPAVKEEEQDEDHEDSEEALKKVREWDEFKDENRRGWGNKKNMG